VAVGEQKPQLIPGKVRLPLRVGHWQLELVSTQGVALTFKPKKLTANVASKVVSASELVSE
jgi:hypothetical protein